MIPHHIYYQLAIVGLLWILSQIFIRGHMRYDLPS